MTDPSKLAARLFWVLFTLAGLLVALFYLPESTRPNHSQVIFPIMVLSGVLAGFVKRTRLPPRLYTAGRSI